jgi:chromosome segregation ATPase
MKNILRFFALCAVLTLTTMGCQTKKVNQLEEENESLRSKIIRSDSIQTQFMNAYSEIEYNLSEIRAREKNIDRYSNEPGVRNNSSMQEKILEDIAVIGRLLEDNRVKLANMSSLQKQLISVKADNARLKKIIYAREQNTGGYYGYDNSSSSKIEMENRATRKLFEQQQKSPEQTEQTQQAEQTEQESRSTAANNSAAAAEITRLQELNQSLQNTVAMLRQQIAESEARIESLQEQLSLLEEAYAALQVINEGLQAENSQYKSALEASQAEIEQKDTEISRLNETVLQAYYFIGTKKDAAAKGLIVRSGAAPVYKDADFIRVENIFEKKIIETKSAKPIIISNHPTSSYSLDTKDKENVKIVIKNPDQFWKITKYLLVITPK